MAIVTEAVCDNCGRRAPAEDRGYERTLNYPDGWLLIIEPPKPSTSLAIDVSVCSWECLQNVGATRGYLNGTQVRVAQRA